LKKQIATWTLPRYVQDLAWSPSGGKLAVLFNGRFDGTDPPPAGGLKATKQFRRGIDETAPGPDVWVVDSRSGESGLRFKTGSNQGKIAFSPDGQLIYVIQDFYYSYPGSKGVIGVYSAVSGERVRTLTAGPRGVHSYFEISPDGKLIAANASSEVPQRFHIEPIWGAQIARVVLLDAHSGKLLFERHREASGEMSNQGMEVFGFSPDGRLLYVNAAPSGRIPYAHIEVYSLDGLSKNGN
jgi:WD40 repeat protein